MYQVLHDTNNVTDSHRRTGRGVRGGSWPPNSGRYMTFIRAKDNTFVWLTVSPRTEQVSIYLRYISGGLTKETFIGYSLRPSKTGTAIVHYYFFSLARPRDKQVVFAIRAKLGLTPQMDVRPYAYADSGCHWHCVGADHSSRDQGCWQCGSVASSSELFTVVRHYLRWVGRG